MRCFFTHPLPAPAAEMLAHVPNLELVTHREGADILVCLLTDRIDAAAMDAVGPSLRLIANYAVGFDNIDLAAAKERGILVTNTPAEEVSVAVAEHTVALILAVARHLVASDAFTRQGEYHGWDPFLFVGPSLQGKTLGIIGAGAIGSHVARAMHAGFGMHILYTSPHANSDLEASGDARKCELPELLATADVVSVHVPLTPETTHLISAKELARMKPSAILINTARGKIVDETALVQALQQKTLAGAGLDVYECEPLIDCNPNDTLELRQFSNVVLTPHTASATVEARAAMSRELAKNILAFIEGNEPPHIVKS